jgi:hypothetical protein
LALIEGIHALLAAAHEALDPSSKVRLAAVEEGAIVGLRIERAESPSADDIANGLRALLAGFGPSKPPPEPRAVPLVNLLRDVMTLVERRANEPEARLRAIHFMGEPQPGVALRLDSPGVAPPEPKPPSAPALGPVHRNLADLTLAALESLAHARQASAQANLTLGGAQQGEPSEADVGEVINNLAKLDRSLLFLGDGLCLIGAQLTGEDSELTPHHHALALHRLIMALSAMAPDMQRAIDRSTLEAAAAAFTTT